MQNVGEGCDWIYILVLEKTLESPLDCKEIQPFPPKGDQTWVFIGRTGVEAETPILWPPDVKNWCEESWKRPRCWERLKVGGEGNDRGWDGWMASLTQWTWVEKTPGVGDGQEGQACCSPWSRQESDTTEQLNWTMMLLLMWLLGDITVNRHGPWSLGSTGENEH